MIPDALPDIELIPMIRSVISKIPMKKRNKSFNFFSTIYNWYMNLTSITSKLNLSWFPVTELSEIFYVTILPDNIKETEIESKTGCAKHVISCLIFQYENIYGLNEFKQPYVNPLSLQPDNNSIRSSIINIPEPFTTITDSILKATTVNQDTQIDLPVQKPQSPMKTEKLEFEGPSVARKFEILETITEISPDASKNGSCDSFDFDLYREDIDYETFIITVSDPAGLVIYSTDLRPDVESDLVESKEDKVIWDKQSVEAKQKYHQELLLRQKQDLDSIKVVSEEITKIKYDLAAIKPELIGDETLTSVDFDNIQVCLFN